VAEKEQAILIGVQLSETDFEHVEESLDELEQLVITAGAEVASRIIQVRETPHSRTFIGPGKAEEIKDLAQSLNADIVIFDSELTPSQQHNLEDIMSRKVIDRTALILDIFAQHAHSSEGKLQVELAQLVYLLPRIKGRGVELSRLGGGIGTRGPGEQKLEVDRRRIRKRIQHLRQELSHVSQNRSIQRKKRKRAAVFSVSIVGYTNAGKSTLLNALTDAHVHVEDKLFATLDSTTRKLKLPSHQSVVLSDTVGFIKKLPHQLVASFRSTLDEVREANLLLNIIDASHPQMREQIEAVEVVLSEIGAAEKPRINVFNKVDILSDSEIDQFKKRYPEGVFVSALKKEGIDGVIQKIDEIVSSSLVQVEFKISFDKSNLIEKIYRVGRVISEKHSPHGTKIVAEIPKTSVGEFESLLKED
jgi:GTP-binding protein HflX